jgi:tRNA-specific 2-thiouridylase
MDLKNKIDELYNPDKKTRHEKVLIGLSGLDSLVTAYLLKIQKYDLVAVTISNLWEEIGSHQEKAFSCHFSQSKLDTLKSFCNALGIQHIVEKVSGEFEENVVAPWIADRLVGKRHKACWNCHDLRIRHLHRKMKEVGARYLATGHFAKIFHHETHGTVFVHSGNDLESDQSSLLSRLPHDILSDLLLPLSDLSKKEVLKLADNFGLNSVDDSVSSKTCFNWNPELETFFRKKVPEHFLEEGDILSWDEHSNYGKHKGILNIDLGQGLHVRDGLTAMDKVIGTYAFYDKKVRLTDESFFNRNKHMLVSCCYPEEVIMVEPFRGFIHVTSTEKWIDCWVHPKSLLSVSIELSESVKLITGEVVTVYKKMGKNSKVLVTGEVQLLTQSYSEEGEESVSEINHLLDF